MTRAQVAHAEFRHLMRENGVRVLTVRDILAHGVEKVRGTNARAWALTNRSPIAHQSLTNRSPIAHQSLTNRSPIAHQSLTNRSHST
jgi:arginine deiminase